MVVREQGIAPEELTEAINYWLHRQSGSGEPLPAVVSISGAWGSGKTFWWKDYSAQKSRHLYVSLFGLNSIEELENRVIGAAWGVAEKDDQKRIASGLKSIGDLAKVAADAFKDVPGAGILGALNGYVGTAVRDAALARLKGCVIALDDIERRSAALTLQQVLGFISQLREVRKASVVVILNEMRLKNEDPELLREFREKVMDCDFQFAISPSTAARVGLSEHPWAIKAAAEIGEAIALRNIRVYQRASTVLSRLQLDVSDMPPRVQDRLANSVVSLCWAHFEHEPDVIPTVDQLLAFNSMSAAMAKVARTSEQPPDLPYEKTLQKLNWFADAMDSVIAVIVRTGRMPTDSVRKELDVYLADEHRTQADEEINSVWTLYRSSLNGDDKVLAERVIEVFAKRKEYVGVERLSNAVWLLRKLGYDTDANALVDGQIAFWKANQTSFEALLNDRFRDDTDPYLLEQLKLQPDPVKYTDTKLIYDFFAAGEKHASRKEQRALLDQTADAWEAFLVNLVDDQLNVVIVRIRLAYGTIAATKELNVTWSRSPLDEALSRLEGRNQINRLLVPQLLSE